MSKKEPRTHKYYDKYVVLSPQQLVDQTRNVIAETEGKVHGSDLTIEINETILSNMIGDQWQQLNGELIKMKLERRNLILSLPILRARLEHELQAVPPPPEVESLENDDDDNDDDNESETTDENKNASRTDEPIALPDRSRRRRVSGDTVETASE